MKNVKDLKGKCFGWLEVIDFSHITTPSPGDGKRSFWKCKCKCGKILVKNSKFLNRKTNKPSCGCFIIEKNKEKFFKKINITDDCWEWMGYLNESGYGLFSPRKLSHRYMFEHFYGTIPKGIICCHTCDNRKCVNPMHLFLGNRTDNMIDKVNKNRQIKGSSIPNSRLKENDIIEIRKRINNKILIKDIAEEFSISRQTIHDIKSGRTWRHVT